MPVPSPALLACRPRAGLSRGLSQRLSLLATSCLAVSALVAVHAARAQVWQGYAGNAQHTALSAVGSQSLDRILWQTPVDLDPQFNGNDLLIHYGSPIVTSGNTVLVPVKTGATDGFMVQALNGASGAPLWNIVSDYTLPPHGWTPSYGPTLTPQGRLYMAGAGGTLCFRDNLDSGLSQAPDMVAFYGDANYMASKSAFDAAVKINTPLTSDSHGNIYFGYTVTGSNPLGLQSGIAKVAPDGTATYVSASAATGGGASRILQNCAPAISNDGSTVYVAMTSGGSFGSGYLVALNTSDLSTDAKVQLLDPKSGAPALLPDDGTASPTVGPDGHVYFGVLESPFSNSRGWMLQFTGDLSQEKTPGAFGWDDTASIVPASMVPSYHGSSTYLLMTKDNNYASLGGDGVNRIAILDPNDTETDPRTGATVMKVVLSIAGVTPDPEFPGLPDAVREWCINTAVVDPFTDSILANSEDGRLYRWDLATNTFSQALTLTPGVGEAYTPTLIGGDGTVFAINDATLFAVGSVRGAGTPEPGAVPLLLGCATAGAVVIRRRKRS